MVAIGTNDMIFVSYKIRELWEVKYSEDFLKCLIVTS